MNEVCRFVRSVEIFIVKITRRNRAMKDLNENRFFWSDQFFRTVELNEKLSICSICKSHPDEIELSCNHRACQNCLDKWAPAHGNCPTCSEPYAPIIFSSEHSDHK